MVVYQQCESCAAHRRTGVINPAASRVFCGPLPDNPHVWPEGQVVIVGQHISLEPLGVQAFLFLDSDTTAQAFAPPYLKGVAVALVIQFIRTHPYAGLFLGFPDSGSLQALPPVPLTSRQAPLPLSAAIPALNHQYFVSFVYHQSECRHHAPLRNFALQESALELGRTAERKLWVLCSNRRLVMATPIPAPVVSGGEDISLRWPTLSIQSLHRRLGFANLSCHLFPVFQSIHRLIIRLGLESQINGKPQRTATTAPTSPSKGSAPLFRLDHGVGSNPIPAYHLHLGRPDKRK